MEVSILQSLQAAFSLNRHLGALNNEQRVIGPPVSFKPHRVACLLLHRRISGCIVPQHLKSLLLWQQSTA
uniref:Uncharacterized protein n=1 Tax=Arundo donax TaxID=35708 RepID=A0A0A9C0D8_ARUDO